MRSLSTLGKLVFYVALGVGLVLVGRSLREPETIQIPHIVTVYETVPHIDTVWKTKLIKETKWDTVLTERVVTTPPETVFVDSTPKLVLNGVTTLQVGKIGDTTNVLGQKITADTDGVYREPWQVSYFTPGPLVALSTDTFPPRVKFGPIPRTCNTWCGAKKIGIGLGIGVNIGVLLASLFGN